MTTPQATEARKELISAYLLTGAGALGVQWAGGFAAGVAWLAEVARRDAVVAVDVGALVEQLGSAYGGGCARDDLESVAVDFIRAWDIAG